MFRHYGGNGHTVDLAKGLRAAFDKTQHDT